MAISARITGVKKVLEAMMADERARGRAFERGLKKSGLLIQRHSQKLVPIDTGALRNSANTRSEGTGFKTVVYVTYGQTYAIFVHEDLEAKHAPGRQAKFLSEAVRTTHLMRYEIMVAEQRKRR